jgi:N-acetylglutamate synthase-like GNAT family acetyltransferase
MPFEQEDRIREATVNEVGWFFRNASEQDWDGIVPPFIDWGRLPDCDGFVVAEYEGEVIGAIATSSKGMDGSTLPTIANVYVLRDFGRRGVGARLLAAAMERLLAAGSPRAFCKVVTNAMLKTVAKLPPHLKERLECTVDLHEDWLAIRALREETRGLD